MIKIQKINKYKIHILFLILLFGFFTRSYFWFYGYGQGSNGLFIHGDGYYHIAKDLILNLEFNHWRSITHIMYPIYLMPIFIFNINPDFYIFLLHHIFLSLTLILLYLIGLHLKSPFVGLLASFVYACNLFIAYWFNFTLADTAFHFHLALLFLFFIYLRNKQNLLNFMLFFLAGLALFFTRPEGMVYFFCFTLLFFFIFLIKKINLLKTIFVFILFFLAISLIFIFSFKNEKIRLKIMSNVHVGYGLYQGSLPDYYNAHEVNEKLREMQSTCNVASINDTLNRSSAFWCSKIGIDRIKNDPINYLKILFKRIPQLIYPSFYRNGISFKNKLVDRSIMSFIIFGIFLFLISNYKEKIIFSYIIISFIVYFFISIYQSEWDVRVQLSPQIILLPISSIGWLWFLKTIKFMRFKENE